MIQAWGDIVAVVDPPANEQDGTIGGVVLPPNMGLGALSKGVVVSVGPKVDTLSEGDIIYYPHDHCMQLGIREVTKFVRESCIIAWEKA